MFPIAKVSATPVVKQKIESKRFAVKLDNNKIYVINDNTIDEHRNGSLMRMPKFMITKQWRVTQNSKTELVQ